MEQWIPLMVASIGAIAAIGVAFWNSRGDFAEMRQLKSMNEVIATMPDGEHKDVFAKARDALSVRVAGRVASAPGRRRRVWAIVLGVVALGGAAGVVLLVSPYIPDWLGSSSEVLGWSTLFVTLITVSVAVVSNQAINNARAAKERQRAAARLRAMERFLSEGDPGGGRST